MTKSTRNPIRFALEEMHELLNANSDYIFSKLSSTLPPTLRMHLRLHPEVVLVRQMIGLSGNYTSLFRHTGSSAMIFLREISCRGRHGCHFTHGELTITAMTHDDLLRAMFECDLDGTTLEEMLGPDRDHGDPRW